MTFKEVVFEFLLLILVFCNKMLQQLEELSSVKPAEVVRQTYESISAPVVEKWEENEVFWIFGKEFVLPDQRTEFLQYLKSKIWCTYRRGFHAIGGNGPTSDSGWGCMLRSGQMMLAEALTRLNLGHGWNYDSEKVEHNKEYWKLLMQIADKRSSRYSIQQIAQMGVGEGKSIGAWFGPNTIAQVLKKLSRFDEMNNLEIHVAMHCTVVIEDIEKLCCEKDDRTGDHKKSNHHHNNHHTNTTSSRWKPLLLFIPLRLGIDELTPCYLQHLKKCLDYPTCVGFLGGKPNQAFYFLGYSHDSLVFLDPHTTQNVAKFPSNAGTSFDDSTYHCDTPRKMSFDKLDPSLALGFFFPTHQSFTQFCDLINWYQPPEGCEKIFNIANDLPFHNVSFRQKKNKKDAEEAADSDESFEILDDFDEKI